MSTLRFALFLPLISVACASEAVAPAQPSDPMPAPEPPAPQAEVLETEISAEFMVGLWAPFPDVLAIDDKVNQMVEGGMDESQAIMACYQTRMQLRADGSCIFGVSMDGKINGSSMQWTHEQLGPEQLRIAMSTETTDFPLLTVQREGDFIWVDGDPLVAGKWVRIGGDVTPADADAATGSLAIQHRNQREQLRQAEAEIEESMAQREESFETLVQMVRTFCRSEVLTNDLDRTTPLRTDAMNKVRESMPLQEGVLMALPVDSAPKAPVLSEHKVAAEAFDEYWLAGTWKFSSSEMDWDKLLPEGRGQAEIDMKALLESHRRHFEIRGPFRFTLGHPEVIEEIPGYWCLTPGAGPWVWLTMLQEMGSPDVGIVHDRIETFAAYRVGDTLWIQEMDGTMLPYIKE